MATLFPQLHRFARRRAHHRRGGATAATLKCQPQQRPRGSSVKHGALSSVAQNRLRCLLVLTESAVAELARELDLALLGQQALDLVRAQHPDDARKPLGRAAAALSFALVTH